MLTINNFTILDKDNYMCKGKEEYYNYAALTHLTYISKWSHNGIHKFICSSS
jgi:hypothetical protein